MIKFEKQGDLFADLEKAKSPWIIIPHVCNNIGGWGRGFVLAVEKHFPHAKELYLSKTEYVLGTGQICESIPTANRIYWVYNMIAQNGVCGENNKRPLHYGYLANCMSHLVTEIHYARNKLAHYPTSKPIIVCPRFGSDLAGGNFDVIREMIDVIWSDFDTYIYYL